MRTLVGGGGETTQGLRLAFSTTTTKADPGTGTFRANNATFASITELYIDNVDQNSDSITGILDALDDVKGGANARSYIRFQAIEDATVWMEFAVTGAVVDETGYRTVPVSPVEGALPSNNEVVALVWAPAGGGRETLTADRTYYVSTTGSDSNDGLTSGNPFATIAKAWDETVTLDLNGNNVTIQLADGTYTTNLSKFTAPVGGDIIINGNATTPSSTKISTTSAHAFHIGASATVYIRNINIETTTSGHCILAVGPNTRIRINNLEFDDCASSHIRIEGGARVDVDGNYSIVGNAQTHFDVQVGSDLAMSQKTVTLTGTPDFSGQFAHANQTAFQVFFSNTFSGSATGTRYRVRLNAVIDTFGSGATHLPGNAAGTTGTGGQYN